MLLTCWSKREIGRWANVKEKWQDSKVRIRHLARIKSFHKMWQIINKFVTRYTDTDIANYRIGYSIHIVFFNFDLQKLITLLLGLRTKRRLIGSPLYIQHFRAMFIKRSIFFFRKWTLFIPQLLIPVNQRSFFIIHIFVYIFYIIFILSTFYFCPSKHFGGIEYSIVGKFMNFFNCKI